MSKRLILAIATVGTIAGFAGSASATTDYPVTVTRDDNGTTVNSHYGNQPLLGVRVNNDGNVCWGFSYQIGHCTADFLPPIVVTR
ncbi:MAG: hypothetical protein QOK42_558 [Frankiaceae bacterium]|jgi:hypothetical protein|nr:hypothetical protein [Frankiaceae bacterium]